MDLANTLLVGKMKIECGWNGQSGKSDYETRQGWMLCGLDIPPPLFSGSPLGCCPLSPRGSAEPGRTYLGPQGLNLLCPTFVRLGLLFPLQQTLSHCLHSSWEMWFTGAVTNGCGGASQSSSSFVR